MTVRAGTQGDKDANKKKNKKMLSGSIRRVSFMSRAQKRLKKEKKP